MKKHATYHYVDGSSALQINAVSKQPMVPIIPFNEACRNVEMHNCAFAPQTKSMQNGGLETKQEKIDIFAAFVIGCILSFGTLFSMM